MRRGSHRTRDQGSPGWRTDIVGDGPPSFKSLFKLYAWSCVPSLLIAGLYAVFLVVIPVIWTSTTVSIDAVAEVFRFDVGRNPELPSSTRPPGEQQVGDRFSLLLPPGTYSFSDASGVATCPTAAKSDPFFRLCGYSEPTTLSVQAAHLRLTLVDDEPDGESTGFGRTTRLAIRVTPHRQRAREGRVVDESVRATPGPAVEVLDGKTRLLETNEWIEFESDPITYWRAPLQITDVTVGESVSELNPVQPILIDGSVRFFSRGRPWDGDSNRYLIYDEEFDRADSVTLNESDRPVVGLVSFEASSDAIAARPSAFNLVLHSNGSRVEVERLGAKHTVNASPWMQLSPVWAAFWTVFSALTAVIGLRKGGGRFETRILKRRY